MLYKRNKFRLKAIVMVLDSVYRITYSAGALALTGLFSIAAAADDKSATAALFDPDLTIPGAADPTFTRPQAATVPFPLSSSGNGSAETHSVAAGRNEASGAMGRVRQSSKARIVSKLGSGRASWYQHPGRTASGETFRPDGLKAAHHTLPLGSRIRVVNEGNGRSVVVRITDRTNQRTQAKRPYVIDLSRGSARKLGISGIAQVALYRAD